MYCQRRLFKKKKQVVVLLGAGAAMPWGGISSKQIRELFTKDATYNTSDGKTIGQYLFDILDGFYGAENVNFETFIAVLEEIWSYIYNASCTTVIFDLKKEIDLIFEGRGDKRIFSFELLRHYINLIMVEIEKYNNKILTNGYHKLNSSLLAFTKYFLVRGYSVKFYTTNYDSIIPQILSPHMKLYEGLFSSGRFNFNLTLFRNARISHFNLHGSIFLHRVFLKEYETLQGKSNQTVPDIGLKEEGNLLSLPIITGYNKTQRMINKPFNLGFSALTNDLNDCRGLLTVGCSFSDPHINSILSSFTSWNKVRYINVTETTRTFDSSMNREDFRLHDSVTPIFVKSEDDTWLCDTTERKYIYKKGFEEFLKEKLNWKYLHLK
jgi:hypothetical protein